MSRSTLPLAAAAALALVLPGCGEGDVFHTDRPLLKITLDEYRIVPQNIAIPPGRVKFVVRNAGRLTHNFAVQLEGPDGKYVGPAGWRTKTMQPGETAEPIKIEFTPGVYRIVCTIANHDDLGQFGTLEVK